jgi:cysteine desulfuration protein SufE
MEKIIYKLQNCKDKYNLIVKLGITHINMPKSLYTDNNLILGCKSRVWLYAYKKKNNKIVYICDSDAIITRGVINIILSIYSGNIVDKVIYSQPFFISKIGFDRFLSTTRTNGIVNIYKQMKQYAILIKFIG